MKVSWLACACLSISLSGWAVSFYLNRSSESSIFAANNPPSVDPAEDTTRDSDGFGTSLEQANKSHLRRADWGGLTKDLTIGILTPSGSGSGVVIGRNKDLYTAITARHVIPSFNINDNYEIYSLKTGKFHKITDVSYPPNKDVDIMLVQFKSKAHFDIAVINAFYDYSSGWRTHSPSGTAWVTGDGVRGGGISMPTKSVTVPIFRFTEAALLERANGNLNGYELLYQASTVPGMSGGPLLIGREVPCNGEEDPLDGYFSLVAIHGRSEGYDQGAGRSGISLGVPVDLIASYLKQNSIKYGIPVSHAETLSLAQRNYC